jgi:surface polysaccharide O-acyltransferase-like enzyme
MSPWLMTHVTSAGIVAGHGSFIGMFVPFLGFYLLGHTLADVKLSRRWLAVAIGGVVVGGMLVTCGTWLMSRSLGHLMPEDPRSLLFLQTLNPARILLAVSAFLVFRTVFAGPWRRYWLGRLMTDWLAPASLGVYLIHPLVQNGMQKIGFGVDSTTLPDVVQLPLLFMAVMGVSLMIVLLAGCVPGIRWLVGFEASKQPIRVQNVRPPLVAVDLSVRSNARS